MISTGESHGINTVSSLAVADIALGVEASLLTLSTLLDAVQQGRSLDAVGVMQRLRDTAREGLPTDRDALNAGVALVAAQDAISGVVSLQSVLQLDGAFDEEVQEVLVWLRDEVTPAIHFKVLQVARRLDAQEEVAS